MFNVKVVIYSTVQKAWKKTKNAPMETTRNHIPSTTTSKVCENTNLDIEKNIEQKKLKKEISIQNEDKQWFRGKKERESERERERERDRERLVF